MAFMAEMGDVRRLVRDVDPEVLEAEVRYAYVFVPVKDGGLGRFASKAKMLMDEEVAFGFEERRLTVELVAGAALEFALTTRLEVWAIAYLTDGRVVRIRATEKNIVLE